MITIRVARSVIIASCLLLASCTLIRDTMQVTREVEIPVEVTRIVENLVEVTKIVEIPVEVTKLVIEEKEVTREVTRVVEVVVEVTAAAGPAKRPTNTPQPAPTTQPPPTPLPGATSEPQVPSSTESAKQMDQSLRSMGGMIDAALRSGVLGCSDWVAEWDFFMSIPTSAPEIQFAHDHLNNWSEMTDNCRDFLNTNQGGTIPFQQWGTIRQAINEALERIRPLVEG